MRLNGTVKETKVVERNVAVELTLSADETEIVEDTIELLVDIINTGERHGVNCSKLRAAAGILAELTDGELSDI
jgi:hypothetical protein